MKVLFLIFFIVAGNMSFSQLPLQFSQIGSEPALCRTASYQSGNGVVYAEAIGGQGSITYLWENVSTGQSTSNSTWGGLNVGLYRCTVYDSVGTFIVQNVYLDSINPEAIFEWHSPQLNDFFGLLVGEVPVYIDVINTSQMTFACPGFCEPIYEWKLGSQGWTGPVDYNSPPTANFSESNPVTTEICLATWNKNLCYDTLCIGMNLILPTQYVDNGPLLIFSNAQANQLQMFNPLSGNYTLKFYDQSGYLIETKEMVDAESEIDFYHPSGIYIVHVVDIQTESVVSISKFIY